MLDKKGLTMSAAQHMSNLCNQLSLELINGILSVNNYSETVVVDGVEYSMQKGITINTIPITDQLKKASDLVSLQAYLMEAMKLKESRLSEVQNMIFDESIIEKPELIEMLDYPQRKQVDFTYGWNQLSLAEKAEYLKLEATASIYGKSIHKDGHVTKLRNELSQLKEVNWMEIETGKKTPVIKKIHHNSADLLKLHTEINELYRQAESRLNYYKAKIKNLVTLENARLEGEYANKIVEINQQNEVKQQENAERIANYHNEVKRQTALFNQEKQNLIKEISELRIIIPEIFQSIVDELQDLSN